MIGPWREKWIKSKVVKEIYEARWVWYHTLLAILIAFVAAMLVMIEVTLLVMLK